MNLIKKEINELENKLDFKEKIDFSQYIGRYKKILAIRKDKKYLKSFKNWSIVYNNTYTNKFTDNVSYKEWKIKNLKYKDIFILKSDLDNIDISNFNIFIWKDDDWDYILWYLGNNNKVESRWGSFINSNTKIIIFNRF